MKNEKDKAFFSEHVSRLDLTEMEKQLAALFTEISDYARAKVEEKGFNCIMGSKVSVRPRFADTKEVSIHQLIFAVTSQNCDTKNQYMATVDGLAITYASPDDGDFARANEKAFEIVNKAKPADPKL